MAIPKFNELFNPVLDIVKDGKEHSLPDLELVLKNKYGLTDEEVAEMLPSYLQRRFYNRVSWAVSYLTKAGYLNKVKRGVVAISNKGKQWSGELTLKDLFEDVVQEDVTPVQEVTPQESFDNAYGSLYGQLISDILQEIKGLEPYAFERLVVHLFAKVYGKVGEVTPKSHDGGVDGQICLDKFGLDWVYFQAKRWDGSVGSPEIDRFVGVLHKKKGKGIFVTNSTFTSEAVKSANDAKNVSLVDGAKLAELMVEYNVGVDTVAVYEVKRLNSGFFEEL
jgi:restriction system protein